MSDRISALRMAVASAAFVLLLAACGDDTDGFGVVDTNLDVSADVEDAAVDAVADFDYTIPEGAGEAIEAGEPLEILPAAIDATVGQTIRIVNDDVRGHNVGIWFVDAGETLTQTFTSPGELIGQCSVHPSGQIRVTVS